MKGVVGHIVRLLCLLPCLLGCSDEYTLPQAEEAIRFAAAKQHIITRAGDEVTMYEAGTRYHLLGIEHADTYDWSNLTLNAVGTELADHTIDYGNPATFPVTGSLDFFGVTYGTSEAPVVTINAVPATSITLSDSHELPDLMYSNNLKECTSADGRLQMNFRHALSKVSFEIAKQLPEEGKADEIGEVYLKKVELVGTYRTGSLQLTDGAWTLSERCDEGNARLFYSDETGLLVTGVVSDVPVLNNYLFPNGQEPITLRITLEGEKLAADKKVVNYQLTKTNSSGEESEEAFEFLANHAYKLTIMVLNNDVRIVAVTPQVYEWVDLEYNQLPDGERVENETDIYLGQPVTFGNLMWMDRNLGAKTADCENDFYNSIGYYYQFGRNIPYMLDVEKWKMYVNDKDEKDIISESNGGGNGPHIMTYNHASYKPLSYYTDAEQSNLTEEDKAYIAQCQYECMFTYDHLGRKVYGYSTTAHTENSMIRFPGEVIANDDEDFTTTSERYKFVAGTGSISSWTSPNNLNETYWKDVENHPCPKGWRLPTRNDLYSFMPLDKVNWNSHKYPTTYSHAGNSFGKKEEGVYGKVTNADGTTYNVIYLLKNKGTKDAYRIRIMSRFSKNNDGSAYSKNKRYISISRYPASETDDITMYVGDGREETEWNNPVETTDFPGAGFLITDGVPDLRTFGRGSVLRTSDPNSTNTNWVLYLSVTDFQVSVQSGSRRSLGDQVRCVRDINIKE